MMHKDWVKYEDWVYDFVKEKLNGDYDNATLIYFKKTIGDIYNNKSIQLTAEGENAKALEYIIKSLKIYEDVNDNWRLSNAYVSLGLAYQDNNDIKTALFFFNKGLKIARKSNNIDNIGHCLYAIGGLHESEKKYDLALKYYEESLEKMKDYGDQSKYPNCLNSIGRIYEYNGKVKKALVYYQESLIINRKIGDIHGVSSVLTIIGNYYLNYNNIEKAYQNADESYSLATELGYPALIANSSKLMSDIFQKKGKLKKALEMYKLYIKMSDSLSREEDRKKTVKIQANYEYEKQKAIDDAQHNKLLGIEKEKKERQQILTGATAGGFLLVTVFLIFLFNRLSDTKKQKRFIENQKVIVEGAHGALEEKNREIMDSIIYAKRIQSAILPPKKIVKKYLKESFILYKPKDVVAGDFYWMENSGDKVLFAAADCTGHGVPGAMVSVVCNNALNRSVREHGLTDPGEILTKTREFVTQEFEKSEEDVKDGMDIALCCLEGNNLKYAGAHNPLWIIRNGKIIETKANKQPIGYSVDPKPYTTHNFNLISGDSIYVFSDGYIDQFGGKKGKKFKTKAFRELLLSIQDKSMIEQEHIINKTFENWRGNLEQLDDVCVIGVKI